MNHYIYRLRKLYERRVLLAKPAELVAINLELALAFIENNDLPRARQAICLLAETLDFRYELSQHLFNIYAIIEKKLTAGIIYNDKSAVNDSKCLIQLLLNQWKDTGRAEPLPCHSKQRQKITVGLTYNTAGLCEYIEQDYSEGYKA